MLGYKYVLFCAPLDSDFLCVSGVLARILCLCSNCVNSTITTCVGNLYIVAYQNTCFTTDAIYVNAYSQMLKLYELLFHTYVIHPFSGRCRFMSPTLFFLLYLNDLESNVPLYKYVDDSTLFEICNTTDVSVMQESIDRAVNWTKNNCMKINSKNQRKWLFVLLQMKFLGILSRALSLMVILLKQWDMQSCLE